MKKYARRGTSMQARRIVAGLLCLVMLGGLMPALTLGVRAVTWNEETEDYLRKMVEWGVMRGDQDGNLDPERNITRAEFAAMINRAYGYSKPGPTPFTDVPAGAWYEHDVATAYNVGYMKGISETQAGPGMLLTREQAVTLIGRNMMLTPTEGEVFAFSDGRDISGWSRGWIQAAAEAGVALGYEDGTFQPQRNITRGEVAAMLVRAIGSLVQDKGENILGQVYGNLTVNTSGVTLKDTVVAGDLYLTGGIDLGNVMLDNVNVLGRIVVSGAGEGNQATSSVTLRNTEAESMLVDSIADQFVSIRAQGNTLVDRTTVRSDAYLEDQTGQNQGMKLISLSGDPGLSVQMAGNIKDVTNETPSSLLTVARGSADRVSVDEKATNSRVQILNGARVKNMELDVGTSVSGNNMGTGDIDSLKVYSSGSVVEQLPNTIDVRPGVTANVNGTEMDTTLAAESSQDPQLLAGYPKAQNVAPTSAEAVFSTNKPGTVYWALTAVADGSVSKQELLKPSSYSRKIISSGTVTVGASSTENSVKLPKLTMDGSYYISAVMVDNRGQESPVKVTAFTTPDNTVPAFASGYPKMEQITNTSGQVMLMPTKTCQLYYAIMPKGSSAPTVDNFRTGSLSGNLGYGVRNVTKNTIDMFNVNSVSLRELTDYDVYLCLYDADGGQTSGVKKLTFKTKDGTPPIVTNLTATSQAKAVKLSVTMNEKGKFWYVVVERGARFPEPVPGQMGTPSLSSEAAKTAVKAQGKSASASANKAFTVNLSGLQSNSSYDLYYLAEDDAGNSREVVKYPIETLDTEAPRVSLEFTSTNDEAGKQPNAGTGLRVVFSERVKAYEDNIPFLEKYAAMANETDAAKKSDLKEEWGKLVQAHITLMQGDARANNETEVPAATRKTSSTAGKVDYNYPSSGAWVNYEEVTLREEGGNLVFLFGDGTRNTAKAVQLVSGGKYHFKITDVRDLANKAIDEKKPNEPYRMPAFDISIAQVHLSQDDLKKTPEKTTDSEEQYVRTDMWFQLKPDTKAKVEETLCFDVLLWSKSNLSFNLYARVLDSNGKAVTDTGRDGAGFHLLGDKKTTDTKADTGSKKYNDYGNGWVKLGTQNLYTDGKVRAGMSVTRLAFSSNPTVTANIPFSNLKEFIDNNYTFEFAIQKVGSEEEYKRWSDQIKMDVEVVAGSDMTLRELASSVSESSSYYSQVQRISPDFSVERQFQLLTTPDFATGYPRFSVESRDNLTTLEIDSVEIAVQLERASGEYNVHYVLGIVDKNTGKQNLATKVGTDELWPDDPANPPPKSGQSYTNGPKLSSPKVEDILPEGWRSFTTDELKYGTISMGTGENVKKVTGLKPNQTYFAYFVIQSKRNTNMVSEVFCYQFKTAELRVPAITMPASGASVNFSTAADADKLDYALIAYRDLPSVLKANFSTYADSNFNEDSVTAIDKGKDGDNTSFSVMDALMSTVPGENLTYFDKYAKRVDAEKDEDKGNIRTDIAQLARGEGNWNSNLIGNGSISNLKEGRAVSRNTANDIWANKKNAMKNVPYYCLAVARNAADECFAMVSDVKEPKTEVPEIISVSTQSLKIYRKNASGNYVSANPDFKEGGKQYGMEDNYFYSGKIVLSFTEPVYFMQSGFDSAVYTTGTEFAPNGLKEDDKSEGSEGEDEGESGGESEGENEGGESGTETTTKVTYEDNPGVYVYLENHVLSTFDYKVTKSSTASRTFTITFEKIELGSMFIMFKDGDFANEDNVRNEGLQLQLVLEAMPWMSQTLKDKPVMDTQLTKPAFTIYRSPQTPPSQSK